LSVLHIMNSILKVILNSRKSFGLGCAFLMTFGAFSQRSQRHTGMTRSEFGILGGGSYYIGDLNQSHFKNTQFAAQALYRYNIHQRLSFRTNFTYGNIKGADSDAASNFQRNRNLEFKSDLWELASGVELTYMPYEIYHRYYISSVYLMGQLALTRINPKGNLNGNVVELQALATEGQGTSLSDRGKYSRVQLTVPMAIGWRITLGPNVGLNLEYGIRFMFTDYLDDVGSNYYADEGQLAQLNGPLSAEMSNRSLDGNRFERRGDENTRDWYAFAGAGLVFRLGRKTACNTP
jgi:hypothetical protein